MYMYFIIFKNPPPLSASSSWWATLKTWTSLLWLQMCDAPPLALAWALRPMVESHYMVQMTQFWSASLSGSANQNSDKNDKVRGEKIKVLNSQWQIETAALIYVWIKRRWIRNVLQLSDIPWHCESHHACCRHCRFNQGSLPSPAPEKKGVYFHPALTS